MREPGRLTIKLVFTLPVSAVRASYLLGTVRTISTFLTASSTKVRAAWTGEHDRRVAPLSGTASSAKPKHDYPLPRNDMEISLAD